MPGLLNVDVARSQTQQLGHKLFVVLIEAYVPAFWTRTSEPVNGSAHCICKATSE